MTTPLPLPQGIHVGHVVIDGGINAERMHRLRPEALKLRGKDGLLGIEAIADAFWHIHRQPKWARAQEVSLRPFKKPF